MNINKLTDLISERKRLCIVQEKLMQSNSTITVSTFHSYSYISERLEDELSDILKQEAQLYYQKKIEEINKEIEQLCQEQ